MSRHDRHRHREAYKAKFEGLAPEDEQILVAVSPEASYFKNHYLDALLIGLGKIGHAKKITFLVGDTLQRHTAYMKHFGVIYQCKTLMKEALAEYGAENERTWSSILIDYVERLLKNSKLTKEVGAAIRRGADWETIFDKGVWEQCEQEAFAEGKDWRNRAKKKARYFYREKWLTTNAEALFEDLLVEEKDRVLNFTVWSEHYEDRRYQATRELIGTYYKKTSVGEGNRFADLIDTAAGAYVEKFIKEHNSAEYRFPKKEDKNYDNFKKQMLDLCTQYLLEESAVFWNLMQEGSWSAFVYPFHQNDTNPTLYDCIAELRCAVAECPETKLGNIMRPVSVDFHKQLESEPEKVKKVTNGHTQPQDIPIPARDSYSQSNGSSSSTVTSGESPPVVLSMLRILSRQLEHYYDEVGDKLTPEQLHNNHVRTLGIFRALTQVYSIELGGSSKFGTPVSSSENTDDEQEEDNLSSTGQGFAAPYSKSNELKILLSAQALIAMITMQQKQMSAGGCILLNTFLRELFAIMMPERASSLLSFDNDGIRFLGTPQQSEQQREKKTHRSISFS